MPHAAPTPCSPNRTGSILIMVLLILVVAVMIASTFIAQMTAYRISGTRQSARQIAAQTALAGAIYAKQVLVRDYADAYSSGVPQRYNEVAMVKNPRNTANPPKSGGFGPLVYPGPIPADRIGIDWLLPFEGRIHTAETADYVGSGASAFMARFSYAANRHPSAPGGIETTRPAVVDSMDHLQEVALQYAIWQDFEYGMVNNNSASFSTILPYMTPFKGRVHAQSRWLTVGYYDLDFQPLEWADRGIASYEARFSVTPIPLDGCINVNFGDRILSSTTGGVYRLGFRNPNLPPGDGEVPVGTRNSAIGSAKGTFNGDAAAVDKGDKATLDYEIGDTTSVSISDDFPFQAYQVTDATDKDWIGKSFPLSHQYAASLTNMLGSLILRDGGATVSVRKLSNVTWSVKYDNYSVDAAMVMTGGKYKASSGIGELSMLVNIILGQGYRGNRIGYDTGIPGDPWFAPQVPAITQVGTPASWRQMHANMGFTNHLNSNVTSNDEVLPFTNFALTPFGDGLDQTRVPVRNRGSAHVADIDCPWYINATVMSQPATKATICGMDGTWYRNFANPHGENSGIQGYPLHKGNLLPFPPPKADPVDPTKIAVWDDGVACTGADGIEGGAIPIMHNDRILGTTYLRPAFHRNDTGYHFEDPFAGSAYLSWKNPIRDQTITRYASSYVTSFWNSGEDMGFQKTSSLGRSYMHPHSHPTVTRGIHTKAEDHIRQFAMGGSESEAGSVENALGSESELTENKDTADERLAWQNDIVFALLKTMVDLRSERSHGKKLRPSAPHGYEIIEDVETVFLAHLGISVRYLAPVSNASTVAATAADYEVYHGIPAVIDTNYPLGRTNQLWALSQLTSAGSVPRTNEVGYDRGRDLTTSVDLPFDSDTGLITDGVSGQFGFRHPSHTTSVPHPESIWPTHERLPGWPFPAAVLPSPPPATSPYRPTWAALSRVLEHRLNDVRMSLFGTPALDLNGDAIIDATTNDGTGVVTSETLNDPAAQLRFSSTGRWYLGQNRYWRVFLKAELWDRRGDTLADESALEQVIVLDPDGNGDLSDSHVLFSRWHANPITDGRSGPTTAGRTEATLP